MQVWTAITRHGVTRKRSNKKLKNGNLFRKNLEIILFIWDFSIIGLKKAFSRQGSQFRWTSTKITMSQFMNLTYKLCASRYISDKNL